MTPTDPTRPLSAEEEAHEREDWAGWIYSTCQLRGHPAEEHWHPPVGQVPSERAAQPSAALRALIADGIEAFRLTREYVDGTAPDSTDGLLPALPGWSWFDWCEKARTALSPAPTPVEPSEESE